MIERIVLLKLADNHATPDGRLKVARELRERLPTVPGPKSVTVALAADERSVQSWGLSILACFDAINDVEPYLAHPAHRSIVDEYLRPRLACIKAWNFAR